MFQSTDNLKSSIDLTASKLSQAEGAEPSDTRPTEDSTKLFLAEMIATRVEKDPVNPVENPPLAQADLIFDTDIPPRASSDLIQLDLTRPELPDSDQIVAETDPEIIGILPAGISAISSADTDVPEIEGRVPVETTPRIEDSDESEDTGRSALLGAAVSQLNKDIAPEVRGRERSEAIRELISDRKSDRVQPDDRTGPSAAQIKYSASDSSTSEIPEGIKLDSAATAREMQAPRSKLPTSLAQPEFQAAPILDTRATATLASQQEFIVKTQNHSVPMQKVAEALARVTQNQDRLTVRLDPPELGRVTVEFQFDSQRNVTAVISAENADIGSQLREKSEFFFKSLKLAGFDDINLSFETQSDTSKNDDRSPGKQEGQEIGFFASDLDEARSDLSAMGARHRHLNPHENINILL